VLLSIEAMKMETLLRAERDGTVKSVVAAVGMTVDAHDLLIELE
jgi:pyruvate carboxylase